MRPIITGDYDTVGDGWRLYWRLAGGLFGPRPWFGYFLATITSGAGYELLKLLAGLPFHW